MKSTIIILTYVIFALTLFSSCSFSQKDSSANLISNESEDISLGSSSSFNNYTSKSAVSGIGSGSGSGSGSDSGSDFISGSFNSGLSSLNSISNSIPISSKSASSEITDQTNLLYKSPEDIGSHTIPSDLITKGVSLSTPTRSKLPPWRGFNLLDKFNYKYPKEFEEIDFLAIKEFGFNFIRVAVDYRNFIFNYTSYENVLTQQIVDIDRAIEYGLKYNIHVNLDLHTAPGHMLEGKQDNLDLFIDKKAQDLTVRYWQMFTRRYKGIPSNALSFNLLNEPPYNVSNNDYAVFMKRIIDAIKQIDPTRFIIVDGARVSSLPVYELSEENVAQSLHNYEPIELTCYGASWIYWLNTSTWKLPVWPFVVPGSSEYINENWIYNKVFSQWEHFKTKEKSAYMVGEFGVFNKTPHNVTLSYLEENLKVYKNLNIPWALWNFKGEFGIVNSNRADVKYEKHYNYLLDREMLTLLQKY